MRRNAFGVLKMKRPDQNTKWFYGTNAKSRAEREARIRSRNSGKKYYAHHTLSGGYWVGTIEQQKKMRW